MSVAAVKELTADTFVSNGLFASKTCIERSKFVKFREKTPMSEPELLLEIFEKRVFAATHIIWFSRFFYTSGHVGTFF